MNYVTTTAHNARVGTPLAHKLLPDPRGQAFINNARAAGLDIRCACKPKLSSPLIVHASALGKLHLARPQHSEHEHWHRCPHGDAASLVTTFRLPSGSLRSSSGQLVIDFDVLFPESPRALGTGGGISTYTRPNHGQRMYSLAMFLLAEAGLTTLWHSEQRVDSWKRLQRVARATVVAKTQSGTTLENRLLLPSAAYGNPETNWAKLCRVMHSSASSRMSTGRALFASVLPPNSCLRLPGSSLDLYASHGVFLRIRSFVLTRAWSNFPTAKNHHTLGHPVLAFGMATVKKMSRGVGSGPAIVRRRVEQLALIPVGNLLTPTPTPSHWHALQSAHANGTRYEVTPEDLFMR